MQIMTLSKYETLSESRDLSVIYYAMWLFTTAGFEMTLVSLSTAISTERFFLLGENLSFTIQKVTAHKRAANKEQNTTPTISHFLHQGKSVLFK